MTNPDNPWTDTEAVLAELHAVEQRQLAAFHARDLDDAVAPYADDAIMIAPGQPRVEGKAAIKLALGQMFGDEAFAITPQPVRQWVSAQCDMVVALGTFDMTFTDPEAGKPITLAASNLTAWAKGADGQWQIISDYNGTGGGAPGQ